VPREPHGDGAVFSTAERSIDFENPIKWDADMKTFSTKASIRSTPERVSQTLMDTRRWPEMDSSIERVDGTPSLGTIVTVHAKIGRAFPLKVGDFVPNQRMVLSGEMPLGLFNGERTYTVSSEVGGAVTFTMRERSPGWAQPSIT
jgi:hypothetical protein